MIEAIRNNKLLFLIVRILLYYLIVCNICANVYYHLNGKEKIEKIVVQSLTQQEITITSDQIIEKANRQFHTHFFISTGVGLLKPKSKESIRVTFYNKKENQIKSFSYDIASKKVYPGYINLPQKTENLMEEIVNTYNLDKC